MRNFVSISFFILRVGALFFLVVGLTIVRAADGDHSPEMLLAAGVVGVLDSKKDTQTRFEYHFDAPLVWRLKPFLAGGMASDGAVHVGAGLSYRWTFGQRWRLRIGSGPAYYRRNNGFHLGDDLEFFTYGEIARKVGPGRWLGVRVAHVSNGGLGHINPGREMVGLTYSMALTKARIRRY